jgi:hypothetical protein
VANRARNTALSTDQVASSGMRAEECRGGPGVIRL